MDIKEAARLTSHLASEKQWHGPEEGPLGFFHVTEMLDRIECGEIQGEKAHRWLGWAQAACVAAGVGALEDMKEINHAA